MASKYDNINNKKDTIKQWEKKPREITDIGFYRGEAKYSNENIEKRKKMLAEIKKEEKIRGIPD